MKKSTIVCILLAYAMVYNSNFAGVGLTDVATILDYLISGAICAVVLKFMWNFISESDEKHNDDGWEG